MTPLRRRPSFLLYALVLLTALSCGFSAWAQGGRDSQIIIRDAEIETVLKEWLTPLLKAADIDPDGVKIILIQNDQLNAFVAGGANIFIHTGLIEKTKNPGELIGVMAHELGHIAGGHLVATRGAFERASYESIVGAVLGIGAAIATGNGQAASAIISGSSSIATTNFLSHSRVQESSADQAALRFLDGAHMSADGLVSFFETLSSEELLPASQQSAYMRTHPLTRDRIDAVELKAQQSPYKDTASPAAWTEQHARMKAKLAGFINPGQVPWVYSDSDTGIPARYARAIAAYRTNHVKEALSQIDALIASEPSNPYFQELKGQMLVDFGRVAEAIPPYRKAVDSVPNSGLLRMALGHALLESGQSGHTQEAIENLERALRDEPRSGRIHRLLATAYGQLGQENMAKIHLAEEALLQRQLKYAKNQAEGVLKTSAKGSRESIMARDIIRQASSMEKEEE
ncbi:MAG: M48 family metalloprotease [Alphaproteobacteria bacterium]|nr:M48 family metalloprotease [Alphaproteobacteria bacterium]